MPRKKADKAERRPYQVFCIADQVLLGHPIVAYTDRQAVFRYFREQVGGFPVAWRGEYDAQEISWDEYHGWERSVSSSTIKESLPKAEEVAPRTGQKQLTLF